MRFWGTHHSLLILVGIKNQRESLVKCFEKEEGKEVMFLGHDDSHRQCRYHARQRRPRPLASARDDGLFPRCRIIRRRGGGVQRTVPAETLETLLARLRDGSARAVQAAAEDGTTDAGGPAGVDAGVGHGRGGVAVGDDGVPLGGVDGGRESGDVAFEHVRRVGDVDDQRGRGGRVAAVAAEEGRSVVQAQVDERVRVRDRGKGCPVRDVGPLWVPDAFQAPLVRRDQRRTVRIEVVRVGGRVDGEDHIDVPHRLDEWVHGDVLTVASLLIYRWSQSVLFLAGEDGHSNQNSPHQRGSTWSYVRCEMWHC